MKTISIANRSFNQAVDENATALARSRYDRIAALYDLMPMQILVTKRSLPWRQKMWQSVDNSKVLEVGIGTGTNLELWPFDAQVIGIDFSPRMLVQAQNRARKLGREADLRLGDVQCLDFPDASFDVVIATFLFCSVPDPVLGLREVGRVVRPRGRILLLEHMISSNPFLATIMNAINPFAVRMMGANINRRTLENIRAAGLQINRVEDLDNVGIFKQIEAGRS
ncbi:MAG TPA: class I SAM-dependent methyltransferase [Anaerolineales bacterium]|nr:class I SAM-dependent methyltransferase [Anaerolineales bacterium]